MTGTVLTTAELEALAAELEDESELESLLSPRAIADEVCTEGTMTQGTPTPWPALHGKFEFRPGEVTVWGGESGAGKSRILGQVIAWALPLGDKAVIASLEMSPAETLRRMCHQTAGCFSSPDWRRSFCSWADQKLWIYNEQGKVAADRILRLARVATQKLGAKHIVIDSLMKLRLKQDGEGHLTEQTNFVDELQGIAKHHGCHLHLVTHLRKPSPGRRSSDVSKYDIRGASQITDLADNVLLLSWNQTKKRAMEQDPAFRDEPDDGDPPWDEQPDVFLRVDKQRFGPYEGSVGLMLDQGSEQYHRAGYPVLSWPAYDKAPPWEDQQQFRSRHYSPYGGQDVEL